MPSQNANQAPAEEKPKDQQEVVSSRRAAPTTFGSQLQNAGYKVMFAGIFGFAAGHYTRLYHHYVAAYSLGIAGLFGFAQWNEWIAIKWGNIGEDIATLFVGDSKLSAGQRAKHLLLSSIPVFSTFFASAYAAFNQINPLDFANSGEHVEEVIVEETVVIRER